MSASPKLLSLKISLSSCILTLEISKHHESGFIFPLENQLLNIYQHTVGWNGDARPHGFPLGNALSPVPTLQVLSSYFFSSLVFTYFHRSSSLILTNYSNVCNVYLCIHSCKMCFAVLCTCI